ncbi:MAG: preprotein translocase subunit SecG [Verrucomicrobiota bacterium]|jgi:preprotein translocase subunit SecG
MGRHSFAPMSVLGINFLNVSITALIVIYVFVCVLMVFLVLMQRPKQEGLGAAFGASTTDQLFGARTTNVLQRGTVYLSVLFFVLTLTLAILIQKKNRGTSLAKAEEPAAEVQQPAPEKSLSEEIKETSPVVANEAEKVAEPEKAVEEKKEEQPLKEEQPAKQESSKKEDKKPQP